MVLRGARQVGKTTLIRKLAEKLELHLIEINMEESQSFTHMLEHKEKAKEILEHIMLEQGVNVDPKNVVFFLMKYRSYRIFIHTYVTSKKKPLILK
nr:AAA family ATPase [Colwellia maritima]